MPDCGRVTNFEKLPRPSDWKLNVTVERPRMRDRFLEVFKASFSHELIVVEGKSWQEITLVSANAELLEPVSSLLEILSRCVTIADEADISHALAIHRYPDAECHSYIGDLVQRAKYGYQSTQERIELAHALLDFINQHPGYGQATLVACPPSSTGNNRNGLAAHLANTVSRRLGLTRVTVEGPERQPRKQTEHLDDCSDVHGKFRVAERVPNATALVVDDLYGAGCTTNESVRALRAAGARRVLVLACSKTAKRCNGLPASEENWPDWIPSELFRPADARPFE